MSANDAIAPPWAGGGGDDCVKLVQSDYGRPWYIKQPTVIVGLCEGILVTSLYSVPILKYTTRSSPSL
jgi:hypothetical protein